MDNAERFPCHWRQPVNVVGREGSDPLLEYRAAGDDVDVIGQGAAGEVADRGARRGDDGVRGGAVMCGENLAQAVFAEEFQPAGPVAMCGSAFNESVGEQQQSRSGGQGRIPRADVELGAKPQGRAGPSATQRLRGVESPGRIVAGAGPVQLAIGGDGDAEHGDERGLSGPCSTSQTR